MSDSYLDYVRDQAIGIVREIEREIRYVLGTEFDRVKAERDRLKAALRPILGELEPDPMAIQFFDLRIIEAARAAMDECGADDNWEKPLKPLPGLR